VSITSTVKLNLVKFHRGNITQISACVKVRFEMFKLILIH